MAPKFLEPPTQLECIDCSKMHPPRAALIPSPFQSIIAQDRLPTASETAAIRELAEDTDAEVAWRELDIDRLLCEVAELRRRSEHHKAIIAPIRRVPPEVMAEIFLQLAAIEAKIGNCLYDHVLDERLFEKQYLARPFRRMTPLIFGQISREWRAIALSLPSLWNSISLECGNKRIQTNISLCDMWLKRSGSLPLSIRLYRKYYPEEAVTHQTRKHCQDLIKTILPYAKRWRFLDLQNFPTSSYDGLHGLVPGSVPILETLLVSHHEKPTIAKSTPWAGLRIAPKLRLLDFDSLSGANITIQGEWPTFPWSQLTHIDVGDCSAYDCLQILAKASTAVACRFRVTRPSSLQYSPISHSGLKTLKLEVFHDLHPFWNCLTCSTLSVFEAESSPSFHLLQGLPSFLARSGSTIENFKLDEFNMNDTQFMLCLAAMPQLRHLDISEPGRGTQFTNQVWEWLTWAKDSPPPPIPNLESLSLTGAQQSSHKPMVRMLESRVQTVDSRGDDLPKLKTVSLSICRNMSESAYERLMAVRKFGLEIHIDVYSDDEEEDGSEASDTEDGDSDEGDSEN